MKAHLCFCYRLLELTQISSTTRTIFKESFQKTLRFNLAKLCVVLIKISPNVVSFPQTKESLWLQRYSGTPLQIKRPSSEASMFLMENWFVLLLYPLPCSHWNTRPSSQMFDLILTKNSIVRIPLSANIKRWKSQKIWGMMKTLSLPLSM